MPMLIISRDNPMYLGSMSTINLPPSLHRLSHATSTLMTFLSNRQLETTAKALHQKTGGNKNKLELPKPPTQFPRKLSTIHCTQINNLYKPCHRMTIHRHHPFRKVIRKKNELAENEYSKKENNRVLKMMRKRKNRNWRKVLGKGAGREGRLWRRVRCNLEVELRFQIVQKINQDLAVAFSLNHYPKRTSCPIQRKSTPPSASRILSASSSRPYS